MPGGAPQGNTNATKNRLFRQALDKQLKEAKAKNKSVTGEYAALQEIALKLIEQAQDGDLTAIKEIADRVDGKATQAIEHAVAEGVSFKMVIGEKAEE